MIESTDPSLFSAALRMVWGLLIVLGILLVIYALMRKRLTFIKDNSNSEIKIKEIRHIMPKKSLCLVEIGGQDFLLGIGAETITLLSAISKNPPQDSFQETLDSVENKHA
jgi:flagellar protein FliO/FliZ